MYDYIFLTAEPVSTPTDISTQSDPKPEDDQFFSVSDRALPIVSEVDDIMNVESKSFIYFTLISKNNDHFCWYFHSVYSFVTPQSTSIRQGLYVQLG